MVVIILRYSILSLYWLLDIFFVVQLIYLWSLSFIFVDDQFGLNDELLFWLLLFGAFSK